MAIRRHLKAARRLLIPLLPLSVVAPARRDIVIKYDSISTNPVVASDFADPSLINVEGVWYSFASSTTRDGTAYNIQLAMSYDFLSWSLSDWDALAFIPDWVNSTSAQFWAPDVSQVDDGSFVMYYSARANNVGRHCIGAAVSPSIYGPFIPHSEPMFCPHSTGGAIDPSSFRDADGQRYVVYKVDGNAVGNGGSCGNLVEPIVTTPIVLHKVWGDGIQLIDELGILILDRDDDDGPLVEAPSIIPKNGYYYLFYSSNCWSSNEYDVKCAVATNVQGPYQKLGTIMETGTDNLTAPGGGSIAADGKHMVFHANNGDHRSMHVGLYNFT
ncbi:Arabinanase/levansucrase/invertase [Rhizodiscina lignyota]|uniref:Arabinanase/levansucrase/invertase n=1 Tax=Rhizodiscina lignyota TaxID=1504668 RepID=A0A9P4IG38_9PEZI|nr:Arabinanase/levansucrase/invertase [Rhizodiscina lignyota]